MSLKLLNIYARYTNRAIGNFRLFSNDQTSDGSNKHSDGKQTTALLSSFAEAYKKFSKIKEEEEPTPKSLLKPKQNEPELAFATLFRRSKAVQMGSPVGQIVEGTIILVAADDLYIDFGGKFHCVCSRPRVDGEKYKVGAVVKLKIREYEISSKFLGSDAEMSMRETDAVIQGLIQEAKPYDFNL